MRIGYVATSSMKNSAPRRDRSNEEKGHPQASPLVTPSATHRSEPAGTPSGIEDDPGWKTFKASSAQLVASPCCRPVGRIAAG